MNEKNEDPYLFEEMKEGYFENQPHTPITYLLLEKVISSIENGLEKPSIGALTFEKQANRFRRWKKQDDRWVKEPLSGEEEKRIQELFHKNKDDINKAKFWGRINYKTYLSEEESRAAEEEERWDRRDNRGGPY